MRAHVRERERERAHRAWGIISRGGSCVLCSTDVHRKARRQQKDLTLPDLDEPAAAALDDRQLHVALKLPKKFGARFQVKVCACIWSADRHDRKVGLVHELVANWRCKRARIGFAPRLQIVGAVQDVGRRRAAQRAAERSAAQWRDATEISQEECHHLDFSQ